MQPFVFAVYVRGDKIWIELHIFTFYGDWGEYNLV